MNKWMRGMCWDVAIVLSQELGLPMMGLYDQHGSCHHAFVLDAENDIAIDARGRIPLQSVKLNCTGQDIRPLLLQDIEKVGGWLGRPLAPEEYKEALKFVKSKGFLNGRTKDPSTSATFTQRNANE